MKDEDERAAALQTTWAEFVANDLPALTERMAAMAGEAASRSDNQDASASASL